MKSIVICHSISAHFMNGMCARARMGVWVCDSGVTIIKSSHYQIFFNWVIAYRLRSAVGRFFARRVLFARLPFQTVIFHLSSAHPGRAAASSIAAPCHTAVLHRFRSIFPFPLSAG